MKPGSVKIIERLKPISQARATTQMTSLTRGDRVGFQAPDGRVLEGMVLRLDKKTISVATDDGHRWNVAPSLLDHRRTQRRGQNHVRPGVPAPGGGLYLTKR